MVDRTVFVLDVSNIARKGGSEPARLDRLDMAMAYIAVMCEEYGRAHEIVAFSDHSLRKVLSPTDLIEYEARVEQGWIREHSYADPHILHEARQRNGCVVSNDQFRDDPEGRCGLPLIGTDSDGMLRDFGVYEAPDEEAERRPVKWEEALTRVAPAIEPPKLRTLSRRPEATRSTRLTTNRPLRRASTRRPLPGKRRSKRGHRKSRPVVRENRTGGLRTLVGLVVLGLLSWAFLSWAFSDGSPPPAEMARHQSVSTTDVRRVPEKVVAEVLPAEPVPVDDGPKLTPIPALPNAAPELRPIAPAQAIAAPAPPPSTRVVRQPSRPSTPPIGTRASPGLKARSPSRASTGRTAAPVSTRAAPGLKARPRQPTRAAKRERSRARKARSGQKTKRGLAPGQKTRRGIAPGQKTRHGRPPTQRSRRGRMKSRQRVQPPKRQKVRSKRKTRRAPRQRRSTKRKRNKRKSKRGRKSKRRRR